ncbi:MAG: hypothetical protein ACXWDP_05625, partial [Solirubrobacterales bacterium]
LSVIAAAAVALAVLPAAASAFSTATPTSLSYPDRTVGTQSDPKTVTVLVFCLTDGAMAGNPCTVNDTFTPNPTFTGANPGDFAQTNNCGAAKVSVVTAVPGVCVFTITFRPTAQGTRTATLTLGTSTSAAGPPPISLSGVGITAPTPAAAAATGQRAAALAKCKNKKSKKARKKCKKKANQLPV